MTILRRLIALSCGLAGLVIVAVTPGTGQTWVSPPPQPITRFSCFIQAVTVTTQCQVAPAAGLRNYVSTITFSNQVATVQTLDIVYGTGANCVTGITAISHKFQMGTNATTTSPFKINVIFDGPLIPGVAAAICIRPTAATAFGATITGYIAP